MKTTGLLVKVMICQERQASLVLSHTTSQFFWLVDTCTYLQYFLAAKFIFNLVRIKMGIHIYFFCSSFKLMQAVVDCGRK